MSKKVCFIEILTKNVELISFFWFCKSDILSISPIYNVGNNQPKIAWIELLLNWNSISLMHSFSALSWHLMRIFVVIMCIYACLVWLSLSRFRSFSTVCHFSSSLFPFPFVCAFVCAIIKCDSFKMKYNKDLFRAAFFTLYAIQVYYTCFMVLQCAHAHKKVPENGWKN